MMAIFLSSGLPSSILVDNAVSTEYPVLNHSDTPLENKINIQNSGTQSAPPTAFFLLMSFTKRNTMNAIHTRRLIKRMVLLIVYNNNFNMLK
jgi:hypothetical protein